MPHQQVNGQQLLSLFRELAVQLAAEMQEMKEPGAEAEAEGEGDGGAGAEAEAEDGQATRTRPRSRMNAAQKREVLTELLRAQHPELALSAFPREALARLGRP